MPLACLFDFKAFISKIGEDSADIFDFVRCKIGQMKLMDNHLIPLFVSMAQGSYAKQEDYCNLLQIITQLIVREDDEEQRKSPVFTELLHFNRLYKRAMSQNQVVNALTKIFALNLGAINKYHLISKYLLILSYRTTENFEMLNGIIHIIRILLSMEDQKSHDLVHSMAYGNNCQLIKALHKSKLIDVLFCISSSKKEVLSGIPSTYSTPIFGSTLRIIECIFDLNILNDLINYAASQSVSCSADSSLNQDSEPKAFRKPIRHGRFSGSVSVQLSVRRLFVLF